MKQSKNQEIIVPLHLEEDFFRSYLRYYLVYLIGI